MYCFFTCQALPWKLGAHKNWRIPRKNREIAWNNEIDWTTWICLLQRCQETLGGCPASSQIHIHILFFLHFPRLYYHSAQWIWKTSWTPRSVLFPEFGLFELWATSLRRKLLWFSVLVRLQVHRTSGALHSLTNRILDDSIKTFIADEFFEAADCVIGSLKMAKQARWL